MKYLKMLGLAAIAALGLTAIAGGGTASATTLSTENTGGNNYAAGTTIQASLKSGTSAVLKTTGGTTIATCAGSTISSTTSNETGTWVEGGIEGSTWHECNQTTDTIANGSLKIMKTGTNKGEVVGTNSKVTLSVFGTSCTYGTGEGTKLGEITGGEAPELAINANVSKVEGNFLCPASGVWTAAYITTSPHALYIVN